MGRVHLTRLAGLTLVLVLCTGPQISVAQQPAPGTKTERLKNSLYKWRDANGVVHYSETIPQEQKFDTTEMNKQGRVVRQHQHSAEERRIALEKAQKEREEQAALNDKRRRDDALLRIYSDAREIDESRERNVAIPHQAIGGLKVRREKVLESLGHLHKQGEIYDRQGSSRPRDLIEDIDETKRELARIASDIERHEQQIDAIRNKFDEDKRRFKELRGDTVASDGKY